MPDTNSMMIESVCITDKQSEMISELSINIM